ncbi:hypothetical protein HELRODRAFT_172495 [Helobdella robusta]|uniref:Uncharacterized protein n=1 Tax=Helobdella robusta TaxID=6412 RepID=T1F5E6_HELRO|nr:hypothetical protein HELRODRAFT_172495 [Helobdella robusta]ESO04154.1 hypothetical protein HELRODRAFT_172495 [Helobdella robusta]
MSLPSILLTCLISWLLVINRCSAQNGEKCTLKTEVPAFVINDCTGRYIPSKLQNPFSITSVLAIELKPKQIQHQKFTISCERGVDFHETKCSESFPGDNWNDYNLNDQSFVGETVPTREERLDSNKIYQYQTDVQLYQNLYCRIKLKNEIPREPCRGAKLESQPDPPSHKIRLDHNCDTELVLDGERQNEANKDFLKVYGHVCFKVTTHGKLVVDCVTLSAFKYVPNYRNDDACSDTKGQSHGWGMSFVKEENQIGVGTEIETLKYIAGMVPIGEDYSCQRMNPSFELRMGISELEIGANGPKTPVSFVSELNTVLIIDGVKTHINANQETKLNIAETICIESDGGNQRFAVVSKNGRFDTGSGCYKCKQEGIHIGDGWCVPNRFQMDDQQTLCKSGRNQLSNKNSVLK